MKKLLAESEALKLANDCLQKEGEIVSTQEILDSGAVPRLKKYTVQPGKVSDSIFGGSGSFINKKRKKVVFDNPLLSVKEKTALRILIRTNRISTHDISRGTIPFKDQILAINHNFMRKLVRDVMPHAQIDVGLPDHSVVSVAEDLDAIMFENVLRAYMAKSTTTTSLYWQYIEEEKTEFCGIDLKPYADQLKLNGKLPFIMDTPSTKAEHDESVSPEYLFQNHICYEREYHEIINNSLVAFGMVTQYLKTKNLVLVDTKTEHGEGGKGRILAMDELYTMDSSRFWKIKDDGELLLNAKEEPVSFSKEFARGFSKGEQGYTDKQRVQIAARYIMGIQYLTGSRFKPDMRPWEERVITGINHALKKLNL